MAAQLRSGGDLRDQFANVATMQAGRGKAALETAADDAEKAIHDARKSLKKLRSTLRLARPSLGDAWKRENAYWRNVARRMSESRDAAAMVDAFDDVAETSIDEAFVGDFSPIRGALIARRDAVEGHGDTAAIIDRARRSFGRAAARLSPLSWPTDGKALGRGLRRGYSQFREAWKAAKRTGADDDWHRWRKRTKDHAVHIGLLRSAAPAALKRRRDRAKALADLLGKDHDLAVLGALIAGPEGIAIGDAGLRVRFMAALAMRRRMLRRQALKLGRKLCRDKPKAFARNLLEEWQDAEPQRNAAE